MYTLLLSIILLGCALFYHTSTKVKSFSLLLFLFPFLAVLYLQGLGAGFFAFFAYVMGLLSLVVLLRPYRYFRLAHLLGLFALSLILEVYIFN